MSQGLAAGNEGNIASNLSGGGKDSSGSFRIFVLLLGNGVSRVVCSVDGVTVVLSSGDDILSFWL